MKKFIGILLLVVILIGIFTVTSSAASYSPYNSYEYNQFNEAVNAPVGYQANKVINTAALGLEQQIDTPSDIVYKNDVIYVLDSGNSRIIMVDSKYELVGVLENLKISETLAAEKGVDSIEGIVSFKGATGMAVGNDGKIYIADTLSNRVLCTNHQFVVENVILRPDDALNDTEASFAPQAIEVDDRNWLYVASKNIANGLMVFDDNHKFQRFFGANEVLSTTQAIVQFFRDTFLSITQLEFVEKKTPVTISKMDFDSQGFLYTVSPYENVENATTMSGLIKKLNYDSEDILDSSIVFGDVETQSRTWFSDVDVDSDGFVNMLDADKGRVFQYTDDGILLSVFGAKGDQVGCFSTAVALESIEDKIWAVDSTKNCIYVYEPTEYGKTVRKAVLLMKNNDLDSSRDIWQELLEQNSNSQLSYIGLGRIADYNGDYKTAMDYYKRAYAQEDYALAFKQYRQELIEKYIIVILLVVVIIAVLAVLVAKKIKQYSMVSEGAYSKMEQKYTLPFYALLHPLDAFPQFKLRKMASIRVSLIIVACWFLSKIFNYEFTGFAFNINRESDFNLLITILVTAGAFALFVISNWALCTLIDGKGSLKDITATTAYSLIPYVTTQIIATVLTNVLIPAESVFIQIITTVGILWSVLILILGMLSIHEFTVLKTLLSLVLTIFGMAVILFLIVLIVSLLRQVYNFAFSVYQEIAFRL